MQSQASRCILMKHVQSNKHIRLHILLESSQRPKSILFTIAENLFLFFRTSNYTMKDGAHLLNAHCCQNEAKLSWLTACYIVYNNFQAVTIFTLITIIIVGKMTKAKANA